MTGNFRVGVLFLSTVDWPFALLKKISQNKGDFKKMLPGRIVTTCAHERGCCRAGEHFARKQRSCSWAERSGNDWNRIFFLTFATGKFLPEVFWVVAFSPFRTVADDNLAAMAIFGWNNKFIIINSKSQWSFIISAWPDPGIHFSFGLAFWFEQEFSGRCSEKNGKDH